MMDKIEPKYKIGEIVKVCGWCSEDLGTVEGIKWIYHDRTYQYCWGYKCKYKGRGPGLAFTHVPEGYLRKYVSRNDKIKKMLEERKDVTSF